MFELAKKGEWITIDLLQCLCSVIWWLESFQDVTLLPKKKKEPGLNILHNHICISMLP